MDVLANVTNQMLRRVNERVDGMNEKVTVCERRMEKRNERANENIESVCDSANKTMSVLVDKVGECKESASLVINTVDDFVRKVDECVKKVDGYETAAGICNERVSVCDSHVRDCVRRESMGKLERMLRNEVREEREEEVRV